MKINKHTYIVSPMRVLYETPENELVIGKFCSIADHVTVFLGGNHRVDWISTYPFSVLWPGFSHIQGHPSSRGGVTIENDVWVGLEAVILSGVTIQNGAAISAHSVVGSNVGPYEIWGGNPAKCLRTRFPQKDIDFLCELKWWDWEDDQIENIIPLLLSNDIARLRSYTIK